MVTVRPLHKRVLLIYCKVLGVNLDAPFAVIERAIIEAGMGFLIAPRHHTAMRHVGDARKEMGVRTIFNILGPLINPAFVKYYLIGAFSKVWLRPTWPNVYIILGRLPVGVCMGIMD